MIPNDNDLNPMFDYARKMQQNEEAQMLGGACGKYAPTLGECPKGAPYSTPGDSWDVCPGISPKMGAREYAEDAVDRIDARCEEAMENEIIRAREMGRDEGRKEGQEEEARVNAQKVELLEGSMLRLQNLLAKETLNRVALSCYYDLAQKLSVAQECNRRHEDTIIAQDNCIAEYGRVESRLRSQLAQLEERNGWQAERLEEASSTNLNQRMTIQDYHERFESILDQASCIAVKADPHATLL